MPIALCNKKAVALCNNRLSHFVIHSSNFVINLKWMVGQDNNDNNNNIITITIVYCYLLIMFCDDDYL